jgi:putative transposase
MGHTFHELFYHFAWSTHSRVALIRRDYRPGLLKIINEESKKCGGWPIRHNAMPDHVHLLVRLPPTACVSDFIGRVKGASCHRVNEEMKPGFKPCSAGVNAWAWETCAIDVYGRGGAALC